MIVPLETESSIKDEEGHVYLQNTTIQGHIYFRNATVEGYVYLKNITVEGNASFDWTTFVGNFDFRKAFIEGSITFDGAILGRNSNFSKATVEGHSYFNKATIKGAIYCENFDTPHLTFKDAKFHSMSAQEKACRTAKIINDRVGNRDLSDYHYWREMIAKRKQLKGPSKWVEKFTSYLTDKTTGYGTKWRNLLITWLIVITTFGLIYSFTNFLNNSPTGILDALQEGFYFSLVTFTTLGYGDITPQGAIGQILASVESVSGGILMAAFVVVFARKYMR